MSNKHRVTISHLPLNRVQHVTNELHLFADRPDYALFDNTF